jgi:hypothetical protein
MSTNEILPQAISSKALKMEDGRQFTDYRPRNVLDSTIAAQNKIKNNFDYRMFLTNNATKVLHNFRYEATR